LKVEFIFDQNLSLQKDSAKKFDPSIDSFLKTAVRFYVKFNTLGKET
jgi:hypothetical protein